MPLLDLRVLLRDPPHAPPPTARELSKLKEARALHVMGKDGRSILTHDDRLLIRFQKHRIGLTETKVWHSKTKYVYDDGERKLFGWFDPRTKKSLKTLSDVPPSERKRYKPIYARTVDVGDGSYIEFGPSYVDIVLFDLHRDLRSRYTKCLEKLVLLAKQGILFFRPRSRRCSQGAVEDEMRKRLKNCAIIVEYEHNILFEGEFGRTLYAALRSRDIGGFADLGTIYLQGFKRYKKRRISQKYYNIARRDGISGLSFFKLETTFHKFYFKQNSIRIEDFLTQPQIQKILAIDLQIYVFKAIKSLTSAECRKLGLLMELKTSDKTTIAKVLLDPQVTLTKRVRKLRQKLVRNKSLQSAQRKSDEKTLRILEELRSGKTEKELNCNNFPVQPEIRNPDPSSVYIWV
jgi:hypothetical protein